MWAPVGNGGDGQIASLIALDSSSAYRVWVKATSEDGQQATATIDLRTPGIPANPKPSIGKPAGAVMLDGMPFFPMMLYSVCPYQYPAALASGINLFALNACGTFQAQLNALGGAAYSTGIAGGHSASGPGVIGWFHRDEPDGDNVPAANLPGPPPGVPSLSFLTLTNHFYSDAAPLPWSKSPGFYPAYISRADVIGFDLYPLQEWCQPNRLNAVFFAQRELVRLSGEKPTFQWIEADNWKCSGANNVTPATVRAESWLAIAGGAHGLGFWPAQWDPAMNAVISGVGRDVARLGPAIYMPPIAASDNSGNIQVSVRHVGRRHLRLRDQLELCRPKRAVQHPVAERPAALRDGREQARELGRRRLQRPLRAARRAHLHRGARRLLAEPLVRGSSEKRAPGHHHGMDQHALDHKWDLVDAVSRSPLLGTPQIAPGIELAEVERILLGADGLPAVEKERLITSARELADVYIRLATVRFAPPGKARGLERP